MKKRTGDAGDKPVIRTLYDHTEQVNDLSFHPNGLVLASCSNDQSIKLFDLSKTGVKRAFRYLQVSLLSKTQGADEGIQVCLLGCSTCQLDLFPSLRRLFISRHQGRSS